MDTKKIGLKKNVEKFMQLQHHYFELSVQGLLVDQCPM